MTTFPTADDAGSIDSVAKGLLADPEPGEVQEDNAPETEVEAEDAAPEPEAQTEETDEAEDDGVEDEAAEDSDGDEAPQETFTVKVDGEEVAVTLDDLKRSFAGQGYIQKRMQEVASIRKEAEQTYHSLNAERQQVMQLLQAYDQQLASMMNPQPPSEELLKTDPLRYIEEDAAYRRTLDLRRQVGQQHMQLAQKQEEEAKRAHELYLREQVNVLQARIPDFADAQKAGKLRDALIEAAVEDYGYDMQELQHLADARAVQVLHDAMQYRKLMKGRQTAQSKAAKSSAPVVRPGARRSETTSKAKQEKQVRSRMKQTGSVDDVAKFLIQTR